jgi:hypothetical protein
MKRLTGTPEQRFRTGSHMLQNMGWICQLQVLQNGD